jgi:hypothetical protein
MMRILRNTDKGGFEKFLSVSIGVVGIRFISVQKTERR